MLALIQSLFGAYIPITYSETTYVWDEVNQTFLSIQNEIIPAGAAGVNWNWIAGVFLFGIMLYSVLRIVGGLICGRI